MGERWVVARVEQDGYSGAELRGPDGSVALRIPAGEPLESIELRLLDCSVAAADVRSTLEVPTAEARVAFLLGRHTQWIGQDSGLSPEIAASSTYVDLVPTAVQARSTGAPAQTPALSHVAAVAPPPTRPPTFNERRLQVLWQACADGSRTPRVAELAAAAMRASDRPANATTQVEQAIGSGIAQHKALEEIRALAQREGTWTPALTLLIQQKTQQVRWRGFSAKATKEVERQWAMAARARQPRPACAVRDSGVDHRVSHIPSRAAYQVLIDETGSFSQSATTAAAQLGGDRLVALVLPDNHELPPLPLGWHAADQRDSAPIDEVVQVVVDQPVGIIGITREAVPPCHGDAWLAGVIELVAWILRLVPLPTPPADIVEVEFLIEHRGEWTSRRDLEALTTAVLRDLATFEPDRAMRIRCSIRLIAKDESPHNGYVDALAYSWGTRQRNPSSRARIDQSGLRDTVLLMGIPHLRHVRDVIVRGRPISSETFRALAERAASSGDRSMAAAVLAMIEERCRKDTTLWHGLMAEAQAHLQSKAVNLIALGRQIGVLERCRPEGAALSPLSSLAWATARLEAANHTGRVEFTEEAELVALGERLFDEAAPLVCQADLVRAVLATNRLDFDAAGRALDRFRNCEPAVPGLRHWGRVQSSLGQHAAFFGRAPEALAHFEKALSAFSRLSEGAEGEILQTTCYAAIVAMDAHHDASEALRSYLRRLCGADLEAGTTWSELAKNRAAVFKFRHHVLVRWLCSHGPPELRRAYLGEPTLLASDAGHPWPLIDFYRGAMWLQLDGNRTLAAQYWDRALEPHEGAGPLVDLRWLCIRACHDHFLQDKSPLEDPEVTDCLGRVSRALPRAPIEGWKQAWASGKFSDPMAVLAGLLPFNFR